MSSFGNKVANTAIIILAAGSSSRLGQPKQLVKVQDQTLLNKSIKAAEASNASHVQLILGSNADHHKLYLNKGRTTKVAVNEAWEWGMGNSLRFGVQNALLEHPKLDAIVISVCDQPYLDATIFNSLLRAHQKNPNQIIASQYSNDAFGVPVLFPENYFDDLFLCDDQVGAKSIVKQYIQEVIYSPFDKGYIDIDKPEDLGLLDHLGD